MLIPTITIHISGTVLAVYGAILLLPARIDNAVLLILAWVYAVRFVRTKREDRPRLLIADAWTGLNWLMWWLVLFVPVFLLSLMVLWLFKRL